jgi:hypothetical protein
MDYAELMRLVRQAARKGSLGAMQILRQELKPRTPKLPKSVIDELATRRRAEEEE